MKTRIAKKVLFTLVFTLLAGGLIRPLCEGPGPAPLPPGYETIQ